MVDEVDSDDEWITEKEDPIFPEEFDWLDDGDLFRVDAVRTVPINEIYEKTSPVDNSNNALSQLMP